MEAKTSRIPGIYRLSMDERLLRVAEARGLDPARLRESLRGGGLDVETANAMVENAIGTLALPFGVAVNMQVNGNEYLVPMAIEEPSVIAAASHAAKRVRAGGGFTASADAPLMVAQIEIHTVREPRDAIAALERAKGELLRAADEAIPSLCDRGGGARDVTARDLGEGLVVVHVTVDCRDAMGANLLNTVAEAIGPRAATVAGGTLGLRILSNFCDRRCTRVSARVPVDALGDAGGLDGREVSTAIARASTFAGRDPYRAATHNKGIMNGIDAVVVATGNDWRAVEAGAHAFAARNGRYQPLATWALSEDGAALHGELELPLALGIVGGTLRAHRGARLALELLGTSSASELSMVAAAAGLATNLAALRALCTEGIQRGHMALHRRAKRHRD